MNGAPPAAVIAGLLVVCLTALAGVLFVSGQDSLQKLSFLFATIGATTAALVAALRASAITRALNGDMEAKIERAVRKANAERRLFDPPDDENLA